MIHKNLRFDDQMICFQNISLLFLISNHLVLKYVDNYIFVPKVLSYFFFLSKIPLQTFQSKNTTNIENDF